MKGSVSAGDGLCQCGHDSASLETSGRSALAAWGREDWEATVLVGWEKRTPALLCCQGGFCFCCLGFLVASLLGGDGTGSRLQTRQLLSGLLIQFRAGLIIIKIRTEGVVVLWLFSAFYERR